MNINEVTKTLRVLVMSEEEKTNALEEILNFLESGTKISRKRRTKLASFLNEIVKQGWVDNPQRERTFSIRDKLRGKE